MGQFCRYTKTNLLLVLLIFIFYYNYFVTPSLHLNDRMVYMPGRKMKYFARVRRSTPVKIQRRDVNADNQGRKNPCKSLGTCDTSEVTGTIPVCYCDDLCNIYHDCCHDVNQQTMKKKNSTIVIDKIKYMTCETKTIQTHHDKVFGVFMVSKCPSAAEQHYPNMSTLCRNEGVFPVTTENGLTFKNRFCASCHDLRSYRVWTVAFYYETGKCHFNKIFHLNVTILQKMVYLREHCFLWFIPPKSATIRFCVKTNDIDNLTTEDDLCLTYQNPVIIGTVGNYRNIYCYKGKIDAEMRCLEKAQYTETLDVKGYGDLVLTGVFYTRPNNRGTKHECKTDEIKQSLSDVCADCVDKSPDVCTEELIKNYKVNLRQDFITNDVIDPATVLRALTFVYMSWPVQTYDIYLNFISGMYWCSNNDQGKCCVFEGGLKYTINAARTHKQIYSLKTEISNMSWTYRERHINKDVIISKIEDVPVDCHQEKTITSIPASSREIGRKNLKRIIEIFQGFKPVSDYVPVYVNGTIGVKDDMDFVVEDWIATYKENINTNISNNTAGLTMNTKWRPKSILTYMTLGLSCLSLIVTMAVYQHLGLFQHTAGKISKHMMLSLFNAQLFFITAVGANFIYELCLAIAVMSHYLWLSTFYWMSVFCVDVLQTMGKIRHSPGALTLKTGLPFRSIFLGYILPAGFAVPCLLLDIFTDIPIGYTGQICFISGYPANLIAFTLPVLISILTNIITLVTTSILISRYNHTIKSMSTIKVTISFIPLYIRSCVLCAFPWLLGIFADIFDSDLLDYVFIILSGSHGIFVSVSFMSTKFVVRKIMLIFRNFGSTRNAEVNNMNEMNQTNKTTL